MGRYRDKLDVEVIPLGNNYDLILGMPWLRQFNPRIDFKTLSLAFDHREETILLATNHQESNDQDPTSLHLLSHVQLKRAARKGASMFLAILFTCFLLVFYVEPLQYLAVARSSFPVREMSGCHR